MESKKIAIITHAFGACTFPVAKRLAMLGYQVDFFEICLDVITEFECFVSKPIPTKWGIHAINTEWYQGLDEYMGDVKINYYYCRIPRPYTRVPVVRDVADMKLRRRIRKFCRFIDNKKYDCVWGVGAYNNSYFAYIYGYLKTPMVMLLHEVVNHYDPKYEAQTPLMKTIFNRQIDLIVPSHNTASQVINYKGAVEARIHIANLGLSEINRYIPNEHLHDDLKDFVFYFGSLLPYKGINVLYEAIDRHPDCLGGRLLVLAGGGNEDIVNKFRNLPNVVVIPRRMPVTEMVELIQNSYVQVMPYITASQSGIPLAVYVFGKPIVATRIPSLMDYVKDEENGLICEINDPDDLARQLKRITTDEDLYSKCCQNVFKFVQNYPEFSWDASTKTIAEVLEKYM